MRDDVKEDAENPLLKGFNHAASRMYGSNLRQNDLSIIGSVGMVLTQFGAKRSRAQRPRWLWLREAVLV